MSLSSSAILLETVADKYLEFGMTCKYLVPLIVALALSLDLTIRACRTLHGKDQTL